MPNLIGKPLSSFGDNYAAERHHFSILCSIYWLCSWEKEVRNSRMLVYCTPCEELLVPIRLWWSTAQVCARPSRNSQSTIQRFDLCHLPGQLVAEVRGRGRHNECWCMNSDRPLCSSHTQWISCHWLVLCDPERLTFELVSFSSASNYMQQGLSYEADGSSVGQAIFLLSRNTKLHPPVYETLPVDTTL
jgi:hypothetical protein